MGKKILITQSNYIPWKGYFDNISKVDVFVIYDEMQYTKRDRRNRNLIKTNNGLKWLTIPVLVKGRYFQKINETKVLNSDWKKSHLEILKQNYKNSLFFKEIWLWIEDVYMSCNFEYISDINYHFITAINNLLNIKTEIRFSRDLKLSEDRNLRLINICKEFNATEYLTGSSAESYMNLELFKKNDISVIFTKYKNYPIYSQLYGGFNHKVSILDVIFNNGTECKNLIVSK